MADQDVQLAFERSRQLLGLYAVEKPPRFATGDVERPQPVAEVQKALAEAQFLLNEASTQAMHRRIDALEKVRGRQRIINGIHLLTGSGFVLLIANTHPLEVKWAGAVISLAAGFISLTLPANADALGKQIFEDTNAVSALSGELAVLQTRLVLEPDIKKVASDVARVIGRCMELATIYGLQDIALKQGFYPRLATPK